MEFSWSVNISLNFIMFLFLVLDFNIFFIAVLVIGRLRLIATGL